VEEMLFIVQRERPEAFDWRQFAFGKRYRVRILTIELFALAVIVRVDVLRFLRSIVVDVRLGGSSAIEIIGALLGIVHGRVPAITGGTSVVPPLKKGRNYLVLGSSRSFPKCLFDFRVLSAASMTLPIQL
jgi:hypothetical protein